MPGKGSLLAQPGKGRPKALDRSAPPAGAHSRLPPAARLRWLPGAGRLRRAVRSFEPDVGNRIVGCLTHGRLAVGMRVRNRVRQPARFEERAGTQQQRHAHSRALVAKCSA